MRFVLELELVDLELGEFGPETRLRGATKLGELDDVVHFCPLVPKVVLESRTEMKAFCTMSMREACNYRL